MELTHLDQNGNAVMVDVTEKTDTRRIAVAKGCITMSPEAFRQVMAGSVSKGNVLGTAQIAGIMGAKQTSQLIPLCHLLPLTGCTLEFFPHEESWQIEAVCTAKTTGKTGVEMEALTGVSVALLTIYDMCKALDKWMTISDIRLEYKEGGKSGTLVRG